MARCSHNYLVVTKLVSEVPFKDWIETSCLAQRQQILIALSFMIQLWATLLQASVIHAQTLLAREKNVYSLTNWQIAAGSRWSQKAYGATLKASLIRLLAHCQSYLQFAWKTLTFLQTSETIKSVTQSRNRKHSPSKSTTWAF